MERTDLVRVFLCFSLKKSVENLQNTNIRSIFVVLNLIYKVMKLTEQEKELIEAIRNFKKSKHNYSTQLEEWIIRLFEKLLYED